MKTAKPDDDDASARSLQRAQEESGKALEQLGADSPARMTRGFVYVLDKLFRIPGTEIRFGVDPLLSLVPWAGTTVAAVFGTVVLVDSVRLRAPASVLARMVGNYAIDWGLGLIPFVGAIFDTLWQSNSKNLKLLNRTIANREQVRKASVRYWLSVVGLALSVVAVIIAVPIGLVWWLSSTILGG